jgi:hypothetical protein
MKKIAFALLLLFGLIPVVQSQTVDSIKVEQAGDLIKIHYKILNSNQYQVFRITVFCSINGGLKSELKSLSGDSGDNVSGGKSDYLVLWDVLKDVEEVKSVDFSVRAELLKDDTPKQKTTLNISDPEYWSKERFFLIAAMATGSNYTLIGGRLGYMGSFGFSLGIEVGKKKYTALFDKTTYNSSAIGLDLTKRIVNKDNFQLHLIAGLAIGDQESTDAARDYQPSLRCGPDLGLMAGIGRTALYLGYSSIKKPFFSSADALGTSWVDFGIGVRF